MLLQLTYECPFLLLRFIAGTVSSLPEYGRYLRVPSQFCETRFKHEGWPNERPSEFFKLLRRRRFYL